MTPSRRALVVQPSVNPPGGGNSVACWMIQALAADHAVTLLTRVAPDFARANEVFGTQVSAADVRVALAPPSGARLMAWLKPMANLDLWRDHLLLRRARQMAASFDVVVTANNEGDLGTPGVQYIHFPKFVAARPDAGLRWYQGVTGVRVYQRVCAVATGFRMARMRRNVTLVNSAWTGQLVHARHGIAPDICYPPVAGTFPDVPWAERRQACVCVGRIAREKRLESVIGIVAAVRARCAPGSGPTLHIAGNADDQAYLTEIEAVVHTHRDWVTLHVDLPRPALLALLAQCRYGLHGMRDEHFGMAVAELLRAGTIPWACNSGGPVEILNGDRRLLYDTDAEAVEKMWRVLMDEGMAADIRASLRTQAHRFSSERFVREFREHVQRVDARPDGEIRGR